MFGLFKSSPKSIPVDDKVWMTHAAKLSACRAMLELQPGTLFVVWFEKSFDDLKSALNLPDDQNTIVYAKDLVASTLSGRMLVFAEHYPLPYPEQSLLGKLGLKDVPILSALDEPLFQWFGGEKLIDIMKRMGMHEHEVIGHAMVTKSIKNAQRKLGEQVKIENMTKSQEDWFQLNMKGRSS